VRAILRTGSRRLRPKRSSKAIARRIEDALPTSASGSQWWVDPIIGPRGQVNFTRWHFPTDRPRKRKIGDVTAMEVADFNFADAKSAAAETMPARNHVWPIQQFAFDRFTDFNN
jgi:hypothetical protein